MKLKSTVLALLMFSILSACTKVPIAKHVPIPAEKIDCVPAGKRPAIKPEHEIKWHLVKTVEVAEQEFKAYVKRQRDREGVISGYQVQIEQILFECSQDDAWLRKREAELKN